MLAPVFYGAATVCLSFHRPVAPLMRGNVWGPFASHALPRPAFCCHLLGRQGKGAGMGRGP